jgi:predicted ATPase
MTMTATKRIVHTGVVGSPFLARVGLHEDRIDEARYEFDVASVMRGLPIVFNTPVTFFVGENGSGKSTLLEALAWALGFSPQGGHKSLAYREHVDGHALGRALDLSWRQKVSDGFFLRAETFFDWVEYLKTTGSRSAPELDGCSHGEGF